MGRGTDTWLTAQDCADRTGLSVRALRLYEQHGLISPRRTPKGWRLYGRAEIERLHEIVALKAFGLTLREIGALLSGQITDIGRALDTQHRALKARALQAERGLQAIHLLRQRIEGGESATTGELLGLIRTMERNVTAETAAGWARYEQARPRVEVTLPRAQMADLEGAWEFPDAAIAHTRMQDGKLHYSLPGQPRYRLWPEAPDQFFLKGLPVQVTFTRENGKATSLTHSQGGSTQTALRVNAERAEALALLLARRIAEQTPHPDSEAHLRRVIEAHCSNRPDHRDMSPALARIAQEQAEHIGAVLDALGPFQSLTFSKVSEAGLDIFEASFAHGRLETGIGIGPSGKISTLYFA